MCILFRALSKIWWLLALCGIVDAMCAAMNLLMLNPEGSLGLRRFALPNTVWDMSMLALVAGACAITAGLWNSGRGNSWLLSLHGLALSALDSYAFNHKQKYFNNPQAASISWMTLRMDASAL